jgi:hypothetical protein
LNVIKSTNAKQVGIVVLVGVCYLMISYMGFGISCPIHSLTGFFCPGCGGTRAVKALINGDISLAFHNNALLLLSPVFLAIGLAIEKYSHRRMWLYLFLGILLVVVVAFTVLRNQPGSEIAPL